MLPFLSLLYCPHLCFIERRMQPQSPIRLVLSVFSGLPRVERGQKDRGTASPIQSMPWRLFSLIERPLWILATNSQLAVGQPRILVSAAKMESPRLAACRAAACSVSVGSDPYRPLGLHTSRPDVIGAPHDDTQRYLVAHGSRCDRAYYKRL